MIVRVQYFIVSFLIIIGSLIWLIFFDPFNKEVIMKEKGEKNITETRITIVNQVNDDNDCELEFDCASGLFCIKGTCTTLSNFYTNNDACCLEGMLIGPDRTPECTLLFPYTNSFKNCSEISCLNCKTGFQGCIRSGQRDKYFSYCAECLNRFDCKDGYSCKKGLCVKK